MQAFCLKTGGFSANDCHKDNRRQKTKAGAVATAICTISLVYVQLVATTEPHFARAFLFFCFLFLFLFFVCLFVSVFFFVRLLFLYFLYFFYIILYVNRLVGLCSTCV